MITNWLISKENANARLQLERAQLLAEQGDNKDGDGLGSIIASVMGGAAPASKGNGGA